MKEQEICMICNENVELTTDDHICPECKVLENAITIGLDEDEDFDKDEFKRWFDSLDDDFKTIDGGY